MRYFTVFNWVLMLASVSTIFALYDNYTTENDLIKIKRLRFVIIILCGISMAVAFFSIFAHSKNAVWWSNSIGYHYIKYIFSFWL